MKELRFADFPASEYAQRYARIQRSLTALGIDALILTGRSNLRYFAGLRDGAWDANHFYFPAIIPAQGEPVLLAANGFQHLLQQCWIEDVRHWSFSKEFYMSKEFSGASVLLDVIREKGLEQSVLGWELSSDMHPHMGHEHFASLLAQLPRTETVDASDAVWEVRRVKSAAEIARMRKAAEATTRGVRAGFEQLQPGMTEKQVSATMISVMCAEGASEQRFNALYAGPRAMWADGMPTEYEIQSGDLVQFDGGCVYEGYWCDFKRMAAIGEPRAEQKKHYDLAREALEAALSIAKPGVECAALLRTAFEVNDRVGYGAFSEWCLKSGWSAIGHGLGLDLHEQPGLSAVNSTVLEENMVLCVEPFTTMDGVFPFWEAKEKFGLEDVVVVTANGVEVLTSESAITHDLWVVK